MENSYRSIKHDARETKSFFPVVVNIRTSCIGFIFYEFAYNLFNKGSYSDKFILAGYFMLSESKTLYM